jgi:autotransporter family porin
LSPAGAFTLNAPFNYLPVGPFRYELAQASDPSGGTAYRIQAAFDAVDGGKLPALAPSTVGFVAGFTGALSLSESFLSQLYQREGDSALRDEGHTNGWVRGIGRWNNLGQSTFGIGYRESVYGLQGGIGLVDRVLPRGDLLRFGITFGFGTSDGSAELRSAQSDIRVSGTSVGGFATWFADATSKQGAYADLTVQHSWLNFFLDIPVSSIASYSGTSWGGKIETGYRIPFGQWTIEPQVLLTYLQIHADGFIGRDQLIAESNTVDSLLGRARTRLIGLTTLGNGWLLEPHVEFGVLSRLAGDQAVFVGGFPLATNMPTTVAEVGAGGTLAVSTMTTLFADTDVQFGRKYAGLSGRGGLKVRW